MSFPHIFSTGRIGTMNLKNRLVMPPMVRNYADQHGLATDRYVAHIERIAQGGVGMMILEASYIRPDGKGFLNELGLHDDVVIPGLHRLALAAQRYGAKIGIQLYHAGRQTSSKTTGIQPVAPSPIPDPTIMEIPRELTVQEISEIINCYAEAATRAKKAGLDFVELHGAHGYLITQFLSPFSNKRTDAYGGPLSNRLRFLEEVFNAVRVAVGQDFPVTLRLSGDELVSGGLKISDTKRIARRLEKLGLDALHISVGNYASYDRGLMIPPMAIPDEPLVHLSHEVKRVVNIPVITVAKIRTPEGAERILTEKQADFIGIGRMLLADPDYPQKIAAGKLDEINKCIACNQGCISRLFAQQDVWCTVNPACGREMEFAKPTHTKKKVLIIGGGPAGLSAAKTAAERGHFVELYEKHAVLGGQVINASILPYRADWGDFLKNLIQSVIKLGVKIHLDTEFSAATVAEGEFDAAVIAIGSSPSKPNLPGIDRMQVVQARDILEGWSAAKGKIIIAGGGCMGAQLAEVLATRGHSVTIVEAGSSIANEAPTDDRALLLRRLKALKVKIMTDHKVMSVGASSVNIEGPDKPKNLSADTVVMCLGSFPNNGLANELKPLIKNIYVVGDARKPGRVTEAVAEGSLAVLSL